MLVEAFTVFLALIGHYAELHEYRRPRHLCDGQDDEAPEHFGILHAKSLSPRKAIWTLAVISAVIGVIAVSLVFGDAGAPTDAAIKALPQAFFPT